MTELRIRNVDDAIVDIHRHNAKRNGTSLEAELKRILTESAFSKRRALSEQLQRERDELRDRYGDFPSSTEFMRANREGRV